MLIGVLVEYAHLTWEDLYPSSHHRDCQEKESERSCEVDAVPHRFREAARLNFEIGLKEFLSNPLNYVNNEMLVPDTAVYVPGLPPEELASRIFYRNRDDWGTKALDDYTLGELKNAAHSRAKKLLVLEYDDSASVEVLTGEIRQHLKTQKLKGWGSSERSARSSWRLTPESLKRLSLLDIDSPSCGSSRISGGELTAVQKDFSRFNLKLGDGIK